LFRRRNSSRRGREGEHSTEFLLTNNLGVTGKGEFIVVLDSTDRENEGDLIIAAEDVTVEKMAFMVRWTRYTPTARPPKLMTFPPI